MALPTGTVTFLFTDIEGSTKLAQAHPDKWEFLRARHHAILQSAIKSHNGYVFQIIGDAFCASFHTAGDALRAAVRSQIDLYAEDWGDTPIKVRMGLNTGTAQVGEDTDHSGGYMGYTCMARVQRLMSAAHGGQTLISLATEELVRDELPENVLLRDMGERRLKDLIRPERIFQLTIPDLPVDFPPLKTLDAYRHNLPIQMTSFIGREKEMAEIAKAIRAHRLLTLTGIGGTGKTRLSLQASADLIDEFPDGVWFIQLAPISDASLVPQAVASAWNVREQQGRSLSETLVDYSSTKHLLLILDNCEHVAEACALLSDQLLLGAPNIKILATSRVTLNVHGEMTYPVPTLALPDPQQRLSLTALTHFEAVRLFIDRAITVRPAFSVSNANAPAVAQICQHLDGIPLAIELAAARIRALSPDQIAARLGDRFNLLTGGSRTVLPRQQTLRATMDWSYDLLPEDERKLLNQLSVFAGSFSLEAVESVCVIHDESKAHTLDLLTALVDNSLVIVEDEDLETRYRLLETVRQYASEKLNASTELNATQDRHLAFFLDLAERAEPETIGTYQVLWFDRLEKESDNLRAALGWAQEKDAESFLRLASALWRFYHYRDSASEGVAWLDKAMALTEGWHTITRARALARASYVHQSNFDTMRAARLTEEALELSRKLDDRPALALALYVQGAAALSLNQTEAGCAYLEQALSLSRELGDHGLAGISLIGLGEEALYRNDLTQARSLMEQGLPEVREAGDRRRINYGLTSLAKICLAEGDAAQANALIEESIGVVQEIGDHANVFWGLLNLASAAMYLEDFPRARQLLDQASELSQERGYQERGYRIMLASKTLHLGLLAWAHDELVQFVKPLEDILAMGRQRGIDDITAYALYFLAQADRLQQNPELAQARFTEALTFFKRSEHGGICICLDGLAALAMAKREGEHAARLLAASRKLRASTWVRYDFPFIMRERDKLIAEVRAQLGEEALDLAWSTGQAMSQEEMLAYATEEKL
jgi:predicted ATPase/class 3 adenylate cyclase